MFNRLSRKALNIAFALTLASGLVFAQSNLEQKVSFYLDGKVSNEVIKKGTYTVSIPEAEQGTIEIKVGKKVISAPYTKRTNAAQADADKMTYRENGDGSRSIATITPRGQKFTVVLQENGSVATKE